MNIGIDDMSFYRISLSSLDEVKKSINQKSISPDAGKTALLFVNQLINDGDINGDGTITKYEYDQFIKSKESSSVDEWLLKLIDEKGEKLKAEPLTPTALGPYLYEQIGVEGLTEDYQKKYNKVLESGLKIGLYSEADSSLESGLKTGFRNVDSSRAAMSKIDFAYKRLLAIEESKKTGIPIVVVCDSFRDPFIAHGNQIATRDIEKQGLIPLKYEYWDAKNDLLNMVNELIDLKKKGVNIQSFNFSIGQGKERELTVTQLKEALEKDGIVETGEIKDNGSNLVNYKSQIRDWLLNGKGGVYGPVMPGLEQLGLGYYRESISALDKLAANSINFVNAVGNDGPGTISIYSFVQDATPVGALNASGEIAEYSSETSLVRDYAVVKGNQISIYEQGSDKIRHDYDGDGVYDEELLLLDVYELDALKLADKKVVEDLRALVTKLCTNKSENNVTAFNDFIEGYVFNNKDLDLIKQDIELIKQKNNDNPNISELLIKEINRAQGKFYGNIGSFISDNQSSYHPLNHFNEILVNPDNAKLQFIDKSPIEGTSFAAPQVAVEKATVHSIPEKESRKAIKCVWWIPWCQQPI